MRLVDLNPRWVSAGPRRRGVGVCFDCPGACCADKPLSELHPGDKPEDQTKERACVFFSNPVDGGPPVGDGPHWERTGDAFEDLTLSPSVDGSSHGHWHGWIRGGEVA